METTVPQSGALADGSTPVSHSSDSLPCEGMDEKCEYVEHALPITFGESNAISQFLFTRTVATRFPDCGQFGPFPHARSCMINESMDGFGFGLPSVVRNCMQSFMQTVVPKNYTCSPSADHLPSSSRQFEPPQGHMKRLLLFDHSAGKGRIFLSTARLEEWNVNTPCQSAGGDASHGASLHMDMDVLANDIINSLAPFFGPDSKLVGLGKTDDLIRSPPQCMTNGVACNTDSGKEDGSPVIYTLAEDTNSSHIPCIGENQQDCGSNSSYWHDNTSDIDALLYSDDEVTSTAHFPEDVISPEASLSDSHSRKRKHEDSSCGDGLSITSSQADSAKESSAAAESIELVSPDIDDDFPVPKKHGSQNMANISKVRKSKIKRTIETLRKIIPGGNCMDATVVLDEAIQYLRLLQSKVQQVDRKDFGK